MGEGGTMADRNTDITIAIPALITHSGVSGTAIGHHTLFIQTDTRILRFENRQSSGIRPELFLYNSPMPEFFEEPGRRKHPRLQQIVDLYPQ